MYLEISARRSGKSYRFAKAVKDKISRGKPVLLIYPTYSMSNYDLTARGIELFNNPLVKVLSIRDLCSSKFKEEEFEEYTYFFNEFDIIPREGLELPIINNAYYVTTPSYLRTLDDFKTWKEGKRVDNLLSLLKKNNWRYTAYTCPNLDKINIAIDGLYFGEEFGMQLFKKE